MIGFLKYIIALVVLPIYAFAQIGTITKIDSIEIATDYYNSSMCRVASSDYYAIIYKGPSELLKFKSVEMDQSGDFIAIVDTANCSGMYNPLPCVLRVAETDYYAFFFPGTETKGWVTTQEISPTTGKLVGYTLDQHEFSSNARYIWAEQVGSSNYYYITYYGASYYEKGTTVEINPSTADITNTNTDDLDFSLYGNYGWTSYMGNGYYVTAVAGSGDDGWSYMTRVNQSTGAIDNSVTDTYEFEAYVNSYDHKTIRLGNSDYLMVWSNSDGEVEYYSFQVDTSTGGLPASNISNGILSNTVSPMGLVGTPTDSLYVLTYKDDSNKGWIRSFYASPTTGEITRAAVDSLKFQTTQWIRFGFLYHATNDIYIAMGCGPNNHGWLYSFRVEGGGGWNHKFNGVEGANISKINGVDRASIKSVNGVE